MGPRTEFSRAEARRLADSLTATQSWRDLALFATGVDTMLRASDLLKLQVCDVTTPSGMIRDALIWRQRKTGAMVTPVLTPFSQDALTRWIAASGKQAEHFLFTRADRATGPAISASTYRRAVKTWALSLGLDPSGYSSHSIRRTKSVFMYQEGCPIPDISRLLGHKSTEVTLHYLGITAAHLRSQALRFDVFEQDSSEPLQG